jgi:hypothetical protein
MQLQQQRRRSTTALPSPPQRRNLPTTGPLFKSASGELSNLRWDLPLEQYQYYWARQNHKQGARRRWAPVAQLSQPAAGPPPH